MKNILVTLALTPLAVTLITALYSLLILVVIVAALTTAFMVPSQILKHLKQHEEDRVKLTK